MKERGEMRALGTYLSTYSIPAYYSPTLDIMASHELSGIKQVGTEGESA